MPLQALALLLSGVGVGAQLVGPGGVVPYGGGGGGPRRVGTVRDWAQGFFVAGSTLDDLNGVYALVDPNTLRRACRTRRCKVAYRNEESDWILAFAGPPVGLKTKSGKETEWVFVDQSGKDRFEHAGDTVIPGAGDSWSHSHRPSPYERTAAEDMAAGDDDDVNELPWQVIYIGDRNMVWNLVNQRRHHNAVIRNAIAGNLVSEFGSLQALAAPDGAAPESKREPVAPPADLVAKADASEAARFAANGDYGKCADAWKAGKYAIQPFWNRAEDAEIVKWASAVAALRRGECCRRSRRFDEARTSLKEALELFPTYGAALVADAALALDAGRASDALRNAERLAWTDRTRDGVRDAVVFAAVDVERRRLAGGTNDSHNHYLVLGVTRDFGTDELRKAFRAASRSAHPDKNDGSTAAFERVSAAHDCLGDPEKRAAYDRGDDLDRGFERDGTTQGMPFSERVLRRYFPEDFKYEPFGDPFERKRDYEREKRRKMPARPNGATIPPGSYLGSCEGCDMEPGGILLCQKCQTGHRGQVEEASINPSSCAYDEHVGNRHGALICEKKPEGDAPALPRGDEL